MDVMAGSIAANRLSRSSGYSKSRSCSSIDGMAAFALLGLGSTAFDADPPADVAVAG